MKFRIQVVCVTDDGAEQMQEVMKFERQELVMETLGLSLAEGKATLHSVQEFVAAQQTAEFLQRARTCAHCGQVLWSKESGSILVHTVYGTVQLPNPRWHSCECQPATTKTFRPLQSWLHGQTSPELLYLELKWASLIPYGGVAGLLEDVLPAAETLNAVTVRNHLLDTAERMEASWAKRRPCFSKATNRTGNSSPFRMGP
jgi:hypothetical protein